MQNQDILNIMNRYSIRGRDTALMMAVEKAAKVAQFNVPVLVTGENGTGKEVFHKILHDGSRRRTQKCLAINCGGLPEDTITSELFGHVKGAYTGSVGDRKGYFEEADGGTLFLDEVGELPLTVQAKLLRVLENGEIIRMGSNEVRKVDVRIVAATNVDLQKAIQEGKFRQDLFYRLSTISIHVPALRERGEDVLTLFRYFAGEVAKRYGMTRKIELTDESRIMVRGFQWPGNVRQLLHLVEELSIAESDCPIITPDVLSHYLPQSGAIAASGDNAPSAQDLQLMKAAIYELKIELDEVREKLGMKGPKRPIAALPPASGISPYNANQQQASTTDINEQPLIIDHHTNDWQTAEEVPAEPTAGLSRPMTMNEIEKRAIEESLKRNGGNKRKVAAELQVSERTIHRKIQEYGLEAE